MIMGLIKSNWVVEAVNMGIIVNKKGSFEWLELKKQKAIQLYIYVGKAWHGMNKLKLMIFVVEYIIKLK